MGRNPISLTEAQKVERQGLPRPAAGDRGDWVMRPGRRIGLIFTLLSILRSVARRSPFERLRALQGETC